MGSLKVPGTKSTPQWNALFTLLFKGFFERITRPDYASKLFLTLLYAIYTGLDVDFGAVLWAQAIQSTLSTNRHTKISCA